jgi:NitT/TauT family transport system ATP-binding protein
LPARWSSHPDLLLMDEPFSALDVLTAETLRTDLLDLWIEGRHADQVGADRDAQHRGSGVHVRPHPGVVVESRPRDRRDQGAVPHPRNRLDPVFRQLVDMTARQTDESTKKGLELGSWLPHVSTNLMAGLIEMLAAAPYHGRADMPEIARSLHLEVDDLFPVAEVLQHLGFADVREGDIFLTPPARVFSEFGTQERKMMFAEHLLRHVPLAARIKKVLNERPGHRAPRVRFEQELEDFLSDSAAEETLDAVINWGRYGEIFSYNDQTEIFSLEDVES